MPRPVPASSTARHGLLLAVVYLDPAGLQRALAETAPTWS